MATETPMNIFVKQVGEEAVPITAMPDDTSLGLKNKLGLGKGVPLRFGRKRVRNSMSLEEAGVKEGSVLVAAFVKQKPPKMDETCWGRPCPDLDRKYNL